MFFQGRLDIRDKHRFKKRVSNQVSSHFPKANDNKVCNPKRKKVRDISSPTKKQTFGNCGKKHYGVCLDGMDNCFGCGKSWNKVRDALM